jgi:glycosyltransferase involved in cell wall biosynthesis
VKHLREIIVVDDGSSDETGKRPYRLQREIPRCGSFAIREQGKGSGFVHRLREVCTPYLLFLDADLRYLKPAHIETLIEPVLSGKAI